MFAGLYESLNPLNASTVTKGGGIGGIGSGGGVGCGVVSTLIGAVGAGGKSGEGSLPTSGLGPAGPGTGVAIDISGV